MNEELKIVGSYARAVFREWWVILIEILLVMTDVVERVLGTWLIPSSRTKVVLGLVVLVIAQYRAYRKLFLKAQGSARKPIELEIHEEMGMQQVTYGNGKLWGALDTALNPDGGAQRAGIAWFIVKPNVSTGSLAAKVALQGYLGASGHDFTYPAIGVTPSGRGVMAFTDTTDTTNPSAAYAPIDAIVGVGPSSDVNRGVGAAQDDGFTSYRSQVGNPPRTRWGDYGSAAVDGNSIWIGSEYIAHTCVYTDWGGPFLAGGSGDNLLGTCAGPTHEPGVRAALGNWSTRISKLTP
jgi:hypothetical protein